jgi:hypothetical protein
MKLAKALKLKNKKVKDLKALQAKIHRSNVYMEGNTPAYDINKLLETYVKDKEDLVKLKVAINKANVAIYEKIVRLAEAKDSLSMLESLSTNSQKETVSFNYGTEKEIKQISVITTVENDNTIKGIQDEIESLQDDIDHYNATTELEGY